MMETVAITLAQWTGGVLIHQSVLYFMATVFIPVLITGAVLYFYCWLFNKSTINIIEFFFFLIAAMAFVFLTTTISVIQKKLKSECEIRSDVVYIEDQEVPIDVKFCRVREELDGEFGDWYIREISKNNG